MPLVEHIERPYVSEHLNISSKGYRLVKNQKDFIDNQNVNIFLFGGSTMFGVGVKDSETIASYIQEIG